MDARVVLGLILAVVLAACGSDEEPSLANERFTGVMTVRPAIGQDVTVGQPCLEAAKDRELIFQPQGHGPVTAELAPGTWSLDPDLANVHVCGISYSVTMPVADWYEYGVNESPLSRVTYDDLSDASHEFFDPSQFYAPGTYE